MKKAILASAFLLAFTMTIFGQDLGGIEYACEPRDAVYGKNKYECALPVTTLGSSTEDRTVQLIVTGPDDIEWRLFSFGASPLFNGDVTNIVMVVNGARRWEIPTSRVASKDSGARFSELFNLNITRDVALEIASANTVTFEAGTRKTLFPAVWKTGIRDAVGYMDRIRSGNTPPSSPKPQFDARQKASSCSLDDLEIKVVKAKFVNICQTRECWQLKGVATLTNKCRESVIVEAKIIGYAPGMKPVAARDFYPGGSNSIPPGEFVFSLDGMLEYDPEIYVFYVKAIGGRLGQ